jgi:hypothetical protein
MSLCYTCGTRQQAHKKPFPLLPRERFRATIDPPIPWLSQGTGKGIAAHNPFFVVFHLQSNVARAILFGLLLKYTIK